MVQNSGREMEKPLIIGKFMKPKCFKHLDISKFPVEWQKKKNKQESLDDQLRYRILARYFKQGEETKPEGT